MFACDGWIDREVVKMWLWSDERVRIASWHRIGQILQEESITVLYCMKAKALV